MDEYKQSDLEKIQEEFNEFRICESCKKKASDLMMKYLAILKSRGLTLNEMDEIIGRVMMDTIGIHNGYETYIDVWDDND